MEGHSFPVLIECPPCARFFPEHSGYSSEQDQGHYLGCPCGASIPSRETISKSSKGMTAGVIGPMKTDKAVLKGIGDPGRLL